MGEIKRITLYKIKPNLDFADYLRGELDTFDAIKGEDDKFTGYIKYQKAGGAEKTEEQIPWLRFLNAGFDKTKYEYEARNLYPKALMALRFEREGQVRHYVAAFGQHGDTFFDKRRIVHDFGIRVGMNICDTDRLRRVQTSVHEAVSRQTERQASTGANLRMFGINTEAEFLRTISGHVKEEYRAVVESFRGRDSIAIKLPKDRNIKWSDLVDTCALLDERYYADTYKDTDFKVYDILRHENDPDTLAALDAALCAKLEVKNFDKVHLSPPEFVESEEYDFTYSDEEDADLYEDLRVEDLFSTPRKHLKGLTANRLKAWDVFIYDSEQEKVFPKWSAYDCLVAELEHNNTTYVLSNGQWREVSAELKQRVADYFATQDLNVEAAYLPADTNIFDAAKNQNREEVYNRATAAADPNVFLFDKGKVTIAGQGLYEICDLFHANRHFVHVKRYSGGSGSISHIFTQTKLYSHAFSTDEPTRSSFAEWINDSAEPENAAKDRATFGALVPIKAADMEEKDFTVVFCLLHEKETFAIADLPFMAQYELMLTHRFLTEDRRYKVGVAFRRVVLGGA